MTPSPRSSSNRSPNDELPNITAPQRTHERRAATQPRPAAALPPPLPMSTGSHKPRSQPSTKPSITKRPSAPRSSANTRFCKRCSWHISRTTLCAPSRQGADSFSSRAEFVQIWKEARPLTTLVIPKWAGRQVTGDLLAFGRLTKGEWRPPKSLRPRASLTAQVGRSVPLCDQRRYAAQRKFPLSNKAVLHSVPRGAERARHEVY